MNADKRRRKGKDNNSDGERFRCFRACELSLTTSEEGHATEIRGRRRKRKERSEQSNEQPAQEPRGRRKEER